MGWRRDEKIPELIARFRRRYDMAANGIDVANIKVIVNRSAALLTYWYYYLLQHLDKQIEDSMADGLTCPRGEKVVNGDLTTVKRIFEVSYASPTLTPEITDLPYMVISQLRPKCNFPKSARERATARSRAPNCLTTANLVAYPNILI